MNSNTITASPDELADLLDKACDGEQKVIIERQSEPIAVLLPIRIYEKLLERLEDLEDIRDADAAMEEYERTSEAIPIEDVMRDLGLEDEIQD